MRIRQIKPEFWSDKALAAFDAETRLFYVGLWMEADDDGYFRNDPDRIAAALYPYKSVRARERFVGGALLRLADSGHVRLLECAKHGTVPNLPRFQIVASTRRVVRVHGEHNAQCTDNGPPVGNREQGTGNGTGKREPLRTHASTRESLEAILLDESSSEPAKRAARKALEKMA